MNIFISSVASLACLTLGSYLIFMTIDVLDYEITYNKVTTFFLSILSVLLLTGITFFYVGLKLAILTYNLI
jgi:hypothetical protein